MNTTSLLYFVTLASCLNFTEAANKLYVSQPTLSRHIFELEEEIGAKLFTRTKKGIYLTTVGEHCLASANDILRIHQTMMRYKDSQTPTIFGHLHIGVSPNLSYHEGLPFVAKATKKFPNIDVTLKSGTPNELFSMLMDDALDAVWTLVRIGDSFDGYGLKKISIPNKKIPLVMMNANHPLAGKESVSAADLQGESFILYRDDHSPFSTTHGREFLHALDVNPAHVTYLSDYSMIETYVYLNRGISFINEGIIRPRETDNIILPLADSPVAFQLSLVYKENFRSSALQAYIQELQTHFSEE